LGGRSTVCGVAKTTAPQQIFKQDKRERHELCKKEKVWLYVMVREDSGFYPTPLTELNIFST